MSKINVDFVHAILYLLKLQIDHVFLDGHGQACPGMPKEAFETHLKNCWSSKYDFGPLCLGKKGSYEITTVSRSGLRFYMLF